MDHQHFDGSAFVNPFFDNDRGSSCQLTPEASTEQLGATADHASSSQQPKHSTAASEPAAVQQPGSASSNAESSIHQPSAETSQSYSFDLSSPATSPVPHSPSSATAQHWADADSRSTDAATASIDAATAILDVELQQLVAELQSAADADAANLQRTSALLASQIAATGKHLDHLARQQLCASQAQQQLCASQAAQQLCASQAAARASAQGGPSNSRPQAAPIAPAATAAAAVTACSSAAARAEAVLSVLEGAADPAVTLQDLLKQVQALGRGLHAEAAEKLKGACELQLPHLDQGQGATADAGAGEAPGAATTGQDGQAHAAAGGGNGTAARQVLPIQRGDCIDAVGNPAGEPGAAVAEAAEPAETPASATATASTAIDGDHAAAAAASGHKGHLRLKHAMTLQVSSGAKLGAAQSSVLLHTHMLQLGQEVLGMQVQPASNHTAASSRDCKASEVAAAEAQQWWQEQQEQLCSSSDDEDGVTSGQAMLLQLELSHERAKTQELAALCGQLQAVKEQLKGQLDSARRRLVLVDKVVTRQLQQEEQEAEQQHHPPPPSQQQQEEQDQQHCSSSVAVQVAMAPESCSSAVQTEASSIHTAEASTQAEAGSASEAPETQQQPQQPPAIPQTMQPGAGGTAYTDGSHGRHGTPAELQGRLAAALLTIKQLEMRLSVAERLKKEAQRALQASSNGSHAGAVPAAVADAMAGGEASGGRMQEGASKLRPSSLELTRQLR